MSAVGLPLLLLAAQAAAPAASSPAPPPAAAAAPSEPCQNRQEKQGDIIICAERPNGYRLNSDVMEAKRELKRQKLKRPENFVHNDCATVGPMGCRGGPTIDLLAAAVTAATMVEKAMKGENVGQMFVTDARPSEYQLYQQAKKDREEKEAAAAAKAVAAAARAKAAQPAQPTETSTQPAK
jgi:hypothetical protein